MLAQEALSFLQTSSEKDFNPTSDMERLAKCEYPCTCDNCMNTSVTGKIDISGNVKSMLAYVRRMCASQSDLENYEWETFKTILRGFEKDEFLKSLLSSPPTCRIELSLLSDLHRYLLMFNPTLFLEQLNDGDVSVHVRYAPKHLRLAQTTFDSPLAQPCRIYDFEIIKNPSKQTRCQATDYPYLLHYEKLRLEIDLDLDTVFVNGLPKLLSRACEHFYTSMKRTPASYLRAIQQTEKNNRAVSSSLAFRAQLKASGTLQLMEPERAADRRIFRMYGADRFLEITFSPEVSNEEIKNYLSRSVKLANRVFNFFWFKREDGIRAVLFAESGPNLNYVCVSSVRERCIPSKSNEEMTLGKWVKRMKLNFSTTTVGCVLPSNCMSLLDDFTEENVAQIDGAGLISSTALQAIWEGYMKQNCQAHEISRYAEAHDICPYTGFQGRLAG
jgi:RNA dependent RNA polymerase